MWEELCGDLVATSEELILQLHIAGGCQPHRPSAMPSHRCNLLLVGYVYNVCHPTIWMMLTEDFKGLPQL